MSSDNTPDTTLNTSSDNVQLDVPDISNILLL